MKSTSFKPDASCAILLVGEPKTGKTNLAFAFPNLGIIDCDLNLAAAVRRCPSKVFDYEQPAVLPDGKERPEVDRWNFVVEKTKAYIADPSIQTIFVDGLGVLYEMCMAHIVHQTRLAGTNKTGKMEIQNYGDLARLIRGYVMMLRASGKIVLVSSHQAAEKDEVTGAFRYYLNVPGQTKENLGGLFTDVWATVATPGIGGKTKFAIRTKPTGYHVSLGTSFALDAEIDVTDKTPDQIWSLLSPKLGITAKTVTPTAA